MSLRNNPENAENEPAERSRLTRLWHWLRRYGRYILLAAGLLAIGTLIFDVGPAALWGTLVLCGTWLPVIAFMDAGWMAIESFALASFYGEHAKKIPMRAWVRSAMTHFLFTAVLPAGRTGGEVAQAAILAPYVGSARVSAGAVQIQTCVLWGNTLICLLCMVAVGWAVGPSHLLFIAIGVNAFGTAFLGTVLYLGTRRVRLGGWLGKRFERMANVGPELDTVLREAPAVPWIPILLCFFARLVQTVEYGLVVWIVGGLFTPARALIAQGLHLVGAGLGDIVPNHAGISEAMFAYFADTLGFGAHPEKALAIAIVVRIAGLIAASVFFLTIRYLRDPTPLVLSHPPPSTEGSLSAPPSTRG